MSMTSNPPPGSPRAVVDAVIRLVSAGRYRYGLLHLLMHRERNPLTEVAAFINEATSVDELPPGLTAERVIQGGKPELLAAWLIAPVDVEIERICLGRPPENETPVQLIARMIAAICIDVCVDNLTAAARAASTEDAAVASFLSFGHSQMVHVGVPDMITLDDALGEPGEVPAPSAPDSDSVR
jgi:hypothetical protein